MKNSSSTQFGLFDELEPASNIACKKNWFGTVLDTLKISEIPAWPDSFGVALHHTINNLQIPKIKTLSLFSGGGGLDIAFHSAGFDILEMLEIDPRFAATLQRNTGDGLLGNAKVRCIDIRDFFVPAGMSVDFILGGPPCQTFSAAGRRAAGVKGTTDDRGILFAEYVRLLKILRPQGFLFENVYGITGAQGGEAWRQVQQAFSEAGYALYWRILDAADYGVPQHRERLFIVGIRQGEGYYQFPRPTHGPDSEDQREYYCAGIAIQGACQSDGASLAIKGRWGHLIAEIPPGLNYSYFTQEMAYPKPIFAWRSKFSDFMYKADPAKPVRTIKAQGGLYTGPFSWENRHFSVHEIKRLQTFPDQYELVGSRQVALHQIGNSVPPQMGRILALSILHQVFGVELPFTISYLQAHEELGFRKRKRLLTEHYQNKAKMAQAQQPAYHFKKTTDLGNNLKNEVLYLTDSFALTSKPGGDGIPYALYYQINSNTLYMHALSSLAREQSHPSTIHLTIEVVPTAQNPWDIPLKKAILTGQSESITIFTALWKAFERILRKSFGVDDLVQLSGYYQYSPKLAASLTLDSKQALSSELKALAAVVSGRCVAVQISLEEAAQSFELPIQDMPRILQFLKSLGYEARNHNTNPQIPVGKCLIPYAFPTLTPKSVQLRKKL